jgi:hypothetical protein
LTASCQLGPTAWPDISHGTPLVRLEGFKEPDLRPVGELVLPPAVADRGRQGLAFHACRAVPILDFFVVTKNCTS